MDKEENLSNISDTYCVQQKRVKVSFVKYSSISKQSKSSLELARDIVIHLPLNTCEPFVAEKQGPPFFLFRAKVPAEASVEGIYDHLSLL